jgi:ABC-type histidine transport system ATPase subunit
VESYSGVRIILSKTLHAVGGLLEKRLDSRKDSKVSGHEIVLRNVDLYVEPGNVTSIIGSGGGSKTTLLRCISLFEVPLAMHSAGCCPTSPPRPWTPGSRTEVNKVIRELAQAGLTMVVVPDDPQLAGRISDDIVFMDKGGMVESGRPDRILCNPAESRTAQFVSSNGA